MLTVRGSSVVGSGLAVAGVEGGVAEENGAGTELEVIEIVQTIASTVLTKRIIIR